MDYENHSSSGLCGLQGRKLTNEKAYFTVQNFQRTKLGWLNVEITLEITFI